jgi:short chain dehydrogenase
MGSDLVVVRTPAGYDRVSLGEVVERSVAKQRVGAAFSFPIRGHRMMDPRSVFYEDETNPHLEKSILDGTMSGEGISRRMTKDGAGRVGEKVAIVTAAGSGMGAACAQELAERGYRVALMSPSGKAEDLAEELGGFGLGGLCHGRRGPRVARRRGTRQVRPDRRGRQQHRPSPIRGNPGSHRRTVARGPRSCGAQRRAHRPAS